MSRLQAIGSNIPIEEGVSVRLGDVVPGELRFGIIGVELGEIFDHALGQESQIARRHDVPLGRPARGVAKVAITQPDLRGQTIELSSESLLAARQTLGQYNASII